MKYSPGHMGELGSEVYRKVVFIPNISPLYPDIEMQSAVHNHTTEGLKTKLSTSRFRRPHSSTFAPSLINGFEKLIKLS